MPSRFSFGAVLPDTFFAKIATAMATFVVDSNSVAPGRLGGVEGGVGGGRHFIVTSIGPVDSGNANTNCKTNLPLVSHKGEPGHSVTEPPGGQAGLLTGAIGKQNSKLFAAEPAEDIAVSNSFSRRFGKSLKSLVPNLVPKRVINPFKVIKVDDHQGEGPIVPG